jgi:hypothetical protein
VITLKCQINECTRLALALSFDKSFHTPLLLTGLVPRSKASKWPVAKRRSRHDVAAADSRDKYLKQPLLCSGTGGPLIVRFLGPRKNRSNGNPYY